MSLLTQSRSPARSRPVPPPPTSPRPTDRRPQPPINANESSRVAAVCPVDSTRRAVISGSVTFFSGKQRRALLSETAGDAAARPRLVAPSQTPYIHEQKNSKVSNFSAHVYGVSVASERRQRRCMVIERTAARRLELGWSGCRERQPIISYRIL